LQFASSTFAENIILSIFFAICCFGRNQVAAVYQAVRVSVPRCHILSRTVPDRLPHLQYHDVVAYFIPTPYTIEDSLSRVVVDGHLVMADGTIVELWGSAPIASAKLPTRPATDFVVQVCEQQENSKQDIAGETEASEVDESSSSASDSDSESSYSTEPASPTLSATSESFFSSASTESKSSRVSAYDWSAEDDDDELPPLDFADMVGCSISSTPPAPIAVVSAPSTPRIQPRSFASSSLKQLAVLEEDEEEEEDDEEDCYRYSASEQDPRFISMSAIRLIPSHTLRRTGRSRPFDLIRYMPEASYEQRSAQFMYCFGVELVGFE
jgi:hypothetical protein